MNWSIHELTEIFEKEKKFIDIYSASQLNEIVEKEKDNIIASALSRFRTVYALIRLKCLDRASYYLYEGINVDNLTNQIYFSRKGRIVPNVLTPGYTYYPPDPEPSGGGGGDDCCDDCCDFLEDSPLKIIIAVLAVIGVGALVVCNFDKILSFCGNCCSSSVEGLLECICDDLLGC